MVILNLTRIIRVIVCVCARFFFCDHIINLFLFTLYYICYRQLFSIVFGLYFNHLVYTIKISLYLRLYTHTEHTSIYYV